MRRTDTGRLQPPVMTYLTVLLGGNKNTPFTQRSVITDKLKGTTAVESNEKIQTAKEKSLGRDDTMQAQTI